MSQGGAISLTGIPEQGVEFAVHVARICRLDDVGLDLYFHEGQFGVFELNLKYGKEGFKQAGIDYDKLMEDLIEHGKI